MIRLKDILVEGKENLNEAKLSKLDDGVANLYAYSGIKTKYSDKNIERFGQDVVDKAIKMAPKLIAYKKKLKQIVKDVEGSDEAKILMAMIGHHRGYGGSSEQASISDLFKLN
jgi:23S rRNA A1618 N6-methylase RlmF